MQRIQDQTAAASLPAVPTLSGPSGFFSGSLTGSVVTRIRAWWLNMIQEELIALLAAAGLALDGTATVLQAIVALIAQNTPPLIVNAFSSYYNFTTNTGNSSFVHIDPDGFTEMGGQVSGTNATGFTLVGVTFPIPFPSGQSPVIEITLSNVTGTPSAPFVSTRSSTGFTAAMSGEFSFYWSAKWH